MAKRKRKPRKRLPPRDKFGRFRKRKPRKPKRKRKPTKRKRKKPEFREPTVDEVVKAILERYEAEDPVERKDVAINFYREVAADYPYIPIGELFTMFMYL